MKKEIEIEKYDCPRVNVYKSTGEYYGYFRNDHECDMFRIKMLENDMTNDYYFMWGEIKLTIDKMGNMSDWPLGLYDKMQHDYRKLFQLRTEKRTEN